MRAPSSRSTLTGGTGGLGRAVATVAEGQPVAGAADVIVRAIGPQHEQPGTNVVQLVCDIVRRSPHGRRAFNLGGVAAFTGAPLIDDVVLVGDRRHLPEPVPNVGMSRGQSKRLALTATADEHRNVASRRRVELPPPRLDARQCLGQYVETVTGRAELVPVF